MSENDDTVTLVEECGTWIVLLEGLISGTYMQQEPAITAALFLMACLDGTAPRPAFLPPLARRRPTRRPTAHQLRTLS